MINVVILGCGPDAILAAHAAVGDGRQIRILAPEMRAEFISGPDHLTHNVPGLCKETVPGSIEYRRMGERGSYGLKVYGATRIHGAWDTAEGIHPLYSLRNAYTAGWLRYHDSIEAGGIDFKTLHASGDADIIINTLPAPLLCKRPKAHHFQERQIWRKSMPVHGQSNRVVYASTKDIEWYRWSVIENISTWEFPAPPSFLDSRGHLSTVIVPGPKGTDCDCYPDIIRAGRLGRWDDMVRPHEAYTELRRMFDRANQEDFIGGAA